MARHFSHRPLTPDVVTVWYRPPEILLGCVRYTKSADMWSCGLILGELLLLVPLLPGETELGQLSLIVKLLNPPTDETWPKMRLLPRFSGQLLFRKSAEERDSSDSKNANLSLEKRFRGHTVETVNILKDILQWDPERRITAKKALDHRWFRSEEPRAKDVLMMPTFPELRRGQGVSDMMDAMVVDEGRSAGVPENTDYGGGGRSGWGGGGEGGKGKGRGEGGRIDYGNVAEGGGAAASMVEKVIKRGAEQAGRGRGGGGGGGGGMGGQYLFDFGEGQVERKGRQSDQGGRYAKKPRH